MSRWLLGCGIIALVAVIAVVFMGYRFVNQVSEFSAAQDEVMKSYDQIEEAFSFSMAPGEPIDPDRFAQFLKVRAATAAAAKTGIEKLLEGNVFSRITGIFKTYTEITSVHAQELTAEKMSLEEYEFFTQEVAVLCLTDPDGMAALTTARARLFGSLEELNVNHPEAVMSQRLGPLLHGGRIVLPEADKALILANVEGLTSTVDAEVIDLLQSVMSSQQAGMSSESTGR